MKIMPPALRRAPLFALALTASAFALAGCGHKDTLVGKWQGPVALPSGPMNGTFDFTPDGKETIAISGQVTPPGGMPPMAVNLAVAATYAVNGTNLTQTITTMTINGQSRPVNPSQAHSQSVPFTLDGDHLTLTPPTSKEPITLTRVKE